MLLLLVNNTSWTQIYDCFLFFNELELLEVRLHELYDHVDKFVLGESRETFRGNPKPLYFEANKQHFEKFLDKIIHVIVDERITTNNPWVRDRYQRDQIMRGLKNCNPDDLILISDADEIIRPSVIPEIKKALEEMPEVTHRIVLCNQSMYRYYFNRFDAKDSPWPGSIGLFYKDLKKFAPDYCRGLVQRRLIPGINNAGWQLTYMGGYDRVVTKLTSWAHAEYDKPRNKDRKNIEKTIELFPLVAIDETFPKLIFNNQEKYIQAGFIDVSQMIDQSH